MPALKKCRLPSQTSQIFFSRAFGLQARHLLIFGIFAGVTPAFTALSSWCWQRGLHLEFHTFDGDIGGGKIFYLLQHSYVIHLFEMTIG